ncbi:MAG: HAMP domain-containing protein [Piscinibacter sp.]|uniref:methyl-accepting chemotaxis protein n=1 Tax=Piscinibacter sp. TaxID=1903157 RepID=UPI001B7374CB|nr:methyl-accepting chemotaxis protein [Piscinibacter sp.]MBP6025937.1 HAMP domain-containing protein [Piscinibacter sp.]
MNLNNLKIGQRLALGFGALLALMALMFGAAFMQLVSNADSGKAAEEYDHRATAVAQWTAHTELNITRTLAIAKATGMPQVEAHFGPLMKETSAKISEIQKELETTITSEKGKALMAEVGEKRKVYIDLHKELMALVKNADPLAAESLLNAKVLPAAQSYLGAMNDVLKHENELAAKQAQEVADGLARGKIILGTLLVAALALGGLMAWTIARSVAAPVKDAVRAAETIASGDLTQRIDSARRDELGDLLRSVGRMQESLRTLVGQVRSSTDNIGTASAEIASGNQDLSARTEQTASNLQQTASSMEQLTGTVKQSADSARQANQLAASAAEVAQRGGSVVSQVVSTMDEINASSRKISDIIGTIDGIAFQTNILALNAAVEAARAGEQGRGFAVVAGEVRTLAQRSAEAAREIKALIGASVEKVDTGSKLVADAGSTMGEIVASVQRVTDIIGEITAAASEQSDGIGQVNTAVTQLDQMTQQNAALVEQSAAAAESLKDQAQRLAQVVASFRLAPSSEPTLAAPVALRVEPVVATSAAPVARAEAKPEAKPEPKAVPVAVKKPAAAKPASVKPLSKAIKAVKAATAKPAAVRSEPKPVEPKPAAPARVISAPADGEWETF